MGLSKKIRFEVFKRDGFKCGYCGKTPPSVVLEVDHINPKSMEGDDDINNLLASCFECNRGKSDIPLHSIPPSLAENLEVLKEKEKQIAAYNRFLKKIKKREDDLIETVDDVYHRYHSKWVLSESFKEGTLRNFLRKLPASEVVEAMHIACLKLKGDRVIQYFCGICWNKIKRNQP